MTGEEVKISTEENSNIRTIPDDFYGGANPVIKFKRVEKEVVIPTSPTRLTESEKKLLDKERVVGGSDQLHPANLFSNKKRMALLFGATLVLAIGASSAYYWYTTKKQTRNTPPPIKTAQNNVIVPSTTTANIPVTPAAETQTSTEPSAEGGPRIDFPSLFLGDDVDLDSDDMTDSAEQIFASDPGMPDTDNDIYSDSHEVYNLYNPAGKEPIKLVESGAILEYINPTYGYKLYYPKEWLIGKVDPESSNVLFTALSGENIEVLVLSKDSTGQSFADWFGKNAADEKYSDLVDFETRFGGAGKRRTDFLVYYFEDPRYVYVIKYNTADLNSLNYRIVIKMMARSFRLEDSNEQAVPLQGESASTTGATSTYDNTQF